MAETLAEAPFAVTDGPRRHASYAALAATAPVHRIALPTGQSAWLITGYNEARHALHDPRLVKSEVTAANTGHGLLPGAVYAAMGSHMLNRNPPDHTRLRRLVATAFTRRRVDQLTPRIQQITNELLDAMRRGYPAQAQTLAAVSTGGDILAQETDFLVQVANAYKNPLPTDFMRTNRSNLPA